MTIIVHNKLTWENTMKIQFNAYKTTKTPKAKITILATIEDETLTLAREYDRARNEN